MTIFTSKLSEKKEDGEAPPTDVVSDYKLLVGDDKTKANALLTKTSGQHGSTTVAVAVLPNQNQRRSMFKLHALLLSLIIFMMVIVVGGIMIYRNFQQRKMMYHAFCGVRYREDSHFGNDIDGRNMALMAGVEPVRGEFEQEVTIADMEHERIEVPSIGDTRRATILHDFNKNITALIDREQSYCFIMPLNRTLVMPPQDFWDLLVKLKTGYYIPNVEVVRESYRAVTPPIQDLTPYGFNIMKECYSFSSYKLVREGEPMAMSKRSAAWCEFSGEKWCLGDAGVNRMLCIGIKSCV